MTTKSNNYHRLDFSKINFDNKTIAMHDALKDIDNTTMVSGIQITKAKKDFDNKCVKIVDKATIIN